VLQQHMSMLSALDECLRYIRSCVPPFDEIALSSCVQLLEHDHRLWVPLLEDAPAAVALRSRTLRPFAQGLNESPLSGQIDLAAEMAQFQVARQRLTAMAGDSGHHLDLTVAQQLHRAAAFIVVEPAVSLFDGAAAAASDGYFDHNNMPPWDTWVTLVLSPSRTSSDWGPALLCWVPVWARERVQAGIEVNAEECLHWVRIQDGAVAWE
jgi:hypothetical protein